MFITNGVRADLLTLVVKTDPAESPRGAALFVVDTPLPRAPDAPRPASATTAPPHGTGAHRARGHVRRAGLPVRPRRVASGRVIVRRRHRDAGQLRVDDVVVAHDDLIGLEPGQGFAQLMWQLQYERLAGAAASVGHAAQILDDTIAYARERRTFGRPIAEHRVIAHKLADAATELEAARSLLYSTTWRVMHDEYPVTEISMTKKYCAQVQNRLVDT